MNWAAVVNGINPVFVDLDSRRWLSFLITNNVEGDMEIKNKNRELKGWEIFVVAIIFFLVSYMVGSESVLGTILFIVANVFILFAIVTGIRNLIKKSRKN